MTDQVVFWLLTALALVGALVTVTSHDILRMTAGLGAFLLAVAGFFSLYGAGLLALAEVFLYVGGVLVLLLFAIMLVQRSERGTPDLGLNFSVPAVIAPFALAFALITIFGPAGALIDGQSLGDVGAVASTLLGPLLPQFEVAGLVLLAALAAVVAVMGGDRE